MTFLEMNHLVENIENNDRVGDERRIQAARKIQQVWRKSNAPNGKYVSADQGWQDDAKLKVRIYCSLLIQYHEPILYSHTSQIGRMSADEGRNGIRERWKRPVSLARRLQDGNKMLNNPGLRDLGMSRKCLETQHWLELVDG
jgi:hypothetical protein